MIGIYNNTCPICKRLKSAGGHSKCSREMQKRYNADPSIRETYERISKAERKYDASQRVLSDGLMRIRQKRKPYKQD